MGKYKSSARNTSRTFFHAACELSRSWKYTSESSKTEKQEEAFAVCLILIVSKGDGQYDSDPGPLLYFSSAMIDAQNI